VSWENVKNNFWLWNVLSNHLWRWLSNLVWRDGGMTSHPSALTAIEEHLARVSRTKEGAAALGRLAGAGADMGPGNPDLLGFLLQSQGAGRRRREKALKALLGLAPIDEAVALGCLVVLRPELDRIKLLAARGRIDSAEAESIVVAAAWEIATQESSPRLGSEAVVNAIWTEVRTSAGLRRRGGLEVVALSGVPEPIALESDCSGGYPALLSDAVAKGAVTSRQALIVSQTRIEGWLLTEVAQALGHHYDAMRKERQRTEAALREFARAYCSSEAE
jgi:hypothetical protein